MTAISKEFLLSFWDNESFLRRRHDVISHWTENNWIPTSPSCDRDIPFDGLPDELRFINKDGLGIQCYRWLPARNDVRGVILLMHGVMAHLRLSWLAKTPRELTHRTWGPQCVHKFIEDQRSNNLSTSSTFVTAPEEEDLQFSDWSNAHERSGKGKICPHCRGPDCERQITYHNSWIEALVSSNYAVFGMDLQGHGRSDGSKGLRCCVNSVDDYVEDLHTFLSKFIRPDFPNEELTIFGMSLSGLVTVRYLEDARSIQTNPSRVILIAPFLQLDRKLTNLPGRTICGLNSLLAKTMPPIPLNLGKGKTFRGPQWQQRFGDSDPYLEGRQLTTQLVHAGIEGVKDWNRSKRALVLNHPNLKMLVVHNARDRTNPVYASTESASELYEIADSLGFTDDAIPTTPSTTASNAASSNSPPNGSFDLSCIIFNARELDEALEQSDEDKKSRLLKLLLPSPCGRIPDPRIVYDHREVALDHTLVTDPDSGYVFTKVIRWLMTRE